MINKEEIIKKIIQDNNITDFTEIVKHYVPDIGDGIHMWLINQGYLEQDSETRRYIPTEKGKSIGLYVKDIPIKISYDETTLETTMVCYDIEAQELILNHLDEIHTQRINYQEQKKEQRNEQRKEKKRIYRETHAEEIKERRRIYREEHAEEIKQKYEKERIKTIKRNKERISQLNQALHDKNTILQPSEEALTISAVTRYLSDQLPAYIKVQELRQILIKKELIFYNENNRDQPTELGETLGITTVEGFNEKENETYTTLKYPPNVQQMIIDWLLEEGIPDNYKLEEE